MAPPLQGRFFCNGLDLQWTAQASQEEGLALQVFCHVQSECRCTALRAIGLAACGGKATGPDCHLPHPYCRGDRWPLRRRGRDAWSCLRCSNSLRCQRLVLSHTSALANISPRTRNRLAWRGAMSSSNQPDRYVSRRAASDLSPYRCTLSARKAIVSPREVLRAGRRPGARILGGNDSAYGGEDAAIDAQ